MLSRIGMITEKDIPSIASRISYYSPDVCDAALSDADIVFEAVPETIEAKKAAFSLMNYHVSDSAIVASTTSTILSDELQPFVNIPERFLNAHWLNPAYLVPLVELSPGKYTDSKTTDRMIELLEAIGKVPIVCSPSPGYIVPRIQALAMNEAARMVEEGVASVDDIDRATKYGFGFRFAILGLLEFIDWGGGDILYHASRYMTGAMEDERYASPAIIEPTLNINDYQQQKLAEFVSMLRHIDKMPTKFSAVNLGASDCADNSVSDINAGAEQLVKRYLTAMENRDLESAGRLLTSDFTMTFPGGVEFSSLQQLVSWSKTRYQSIGKTYDQFDQCQTDGKTIVYCYGTLHGTWLDGSDFSGIRFVDRFVVVDGLVESQLVWNDLQTVRSECC